MKWTGFPSHFIGRQRGRSPVPWATPCAAH